MASVAIQSPNLRTGSAKWGRPKSKPTSMRPVLSMSQNLDLTVTGTPTPGIDSSRILQWPEEHRLDPDKSRPIKAHTNAWLTDDDLFKKVKERLTNGVEGIRYMFKERDPLGRQGIVTREGLFHIVQALVGKVSREQYDSFLKAINLHWRTTISFDEFIVRFFDNPAVAKYQIAQKNKLSQSMNLEENLRSSEMFEWCPFTTAPHAFVVFRRKLLRGEVNIRDLLPPACFLTDGRVIQPQLREALAHVGIRLTDSEFTNFWYKFDADSNGSIPVKRFYKTLELSANGLPKSDPRAVKSAKTPRRSATLDNLGRRCKTEMEVRSSNRKSTSVSVSKVDTVEIQGNQAEIIGGNVNGSLRSKSSEQVRQEVTTTKQVETTTTTTKTTRERTESEKLVDDNKLSAHVRALIQQKKNPPQMESILDQLHYKFEETYRNLQSAFHLFDFMNDGYVAKIDFRRILLEFGFEISSLDLEAFLQRSGISVIQGLINYKQFLQRFQSRSDNSIASNVWVRNGASNGYKRIETEETLRIEDIESKVSNFFHSDYLKLLGMLKEKDTKNTGILPANDLRRAINSVLRVEMSDDQFDQLLKKLTQSSVDGCPVINYNNLLQLFNADPGLWNRKKDCGFEGYKYYLGDVTPATPVLRLQEKAKIWMAPTKEEELKMKNRLEEIKKRLTKLFTDRFHVFDKNFQDMDRRRTGYLTKWQLGALLKLCGISMTVGDLDFLWANLETAADNTLSYASLVKTFTSVPKKKPVSAMTNQNQDRNTIKVQIPATALVSAAIEQPQIVTGSAKDRRLTELLNKVKDEVLEKWDVLHSIFLSIDKDGYSSISIKDIRDIFYKLKMSLSAQERIELSNFFDLRASGWFYYLSFMHAIKKLSSSPPKGAFALTKRLHAKAGPTSMALTLHDFLTELKTMLLKKYKTLRGAFKFFDQNRSGFIEEAEMRKSLNELGYTLGNRDFVDIMEFFDRSQTNRVAFNDFKDTLLIVK